MDRGSVFSCHTDWFAIGNPVISDLVMCHLAANAFVLFNRQAQNLDRINSDCSAGIHNVN